MPAISGTQNGRKWLLALCLRTCITAANTYAPHRNKLSDGSIGDAAHAARRSDHNIAPDADADGIDDVCALDLTHDPAGGFDSWKAAQAIAADVAAGYIKCVQYLISGPPTGTVDLIFHYRDGRWQWDTHHTTNHHGHHLHISCRHDNTIQDRPTWRFKPGGTTTIPSVPAQVALPTTAPIKGDTMKLIKLPIVIDAQGNGWRDAPCLFTEFISATPQGSSPPDDGYWPIPNVAVQDRGGKPRITITAAKPSTTQLVFITTTTP